MKLGGNYGENISGKIVFVFFLMKQFKISGNHPKDTEQMKKYFKKMILRFVKHHSILII